jgi:hypothetical protein
MGLGLFRITYDIDHNTQWQGNILAMNVEEATQHLVKFVSLNGKTCHITSRDQKGDIDAITENAMKAIVEESGMRSDAVQKMTKKLRNLDTENNILKSRIKDLEREKAAKPSTGRWSAEVEPPEEARVEVKEVEVPKQPKKGIKARK